MTKFSLCTTVNGKPCCSFRESDFDAIEKAQEALDMYYLGYRCDHRGKYSTGLAVIRFTEDSTEIVKQHITFER